MFCDGVISSLESFVVDVPSHDPYPDLKCLAANTFFLRELCLSAILSLFRPQEVEATRRSLAVVAWEGGGTHYSSIIQSGAWTSEA
jgi:hypothetical protein